MYQYVYFVQSDLEVVCDKHISGLERRKKKYSSLKLMVKYLNTSKGHILKQSFFFFFFLRLH